MEQNFTETKKITVKGIERADRIVQHKSGWYARCRVLRGTLPQCPHCNTYMAQAGTKPAAILRAFAVECDVDGNYTDTPVEVMNSIAPPGDGAVIDWLVEAKGIVRNALDVLLLERAQMREPDEYQPL